MPENKKSYTATMLFSTPADQVWDLLMNFGDKQLYSPNMNAILMPDDKGGLSGTFVIGQTSFRATFHPYDIRLTSENIRIGISIQPQEKGCLVMSVATHRENPPFVVSHFELLQFLSKLKSVAGELVRDSDILHTSTEEKVTVPERHPGEQPSVTMAPQGTTTKRTESPEPARAKKETKPRKQKTANKGVFMKALAAFLLVVVLFAGMSWVYRFAKKLLTSKREQETGIAGGSTSVTYNNGVALSVGVTRAQVERVLGKPASTDGNKSIYVNKEANAYGDPKCKILVSYDRDVADNIQVLDLENATKVGAIQGVELSVGADTGIGSIIEQLGVGPSLVRYYSDDEGSISEYHFGHMDPKGNFSPVWNGELWVTQRDNGQPTVHYGYSYDGSDPLYVADLNETRLGTIYANYDDYLNDYYEYRKCLLMKNRYSRGDCDAILGGMTPAEPGDITRYHAFSNCTLTDGTPAWNYTVGISSNGGFSHFSGVNMRTWKTPGQLEGVSIDGLGVGMNERDLLASVGVLPTMIYIDNTYILYGFGCFQEQAGSQTEQFEVMARINMKTGQVEDFFDNTQKTIVID